MPRFSEREKERIYEKLREEGEKLFVQHGLRKVTVDELSQAAGIAKGTFYHFYESKEHLFMDINVKIQFKLWERMNTVLEDNKALPPKELTRKIFMTMAAFSGEFSLINMMNQDTMEQLIRKLPPEVVEKHVKEDSEFLRKLEKYGVRFKIDRDLAAKIFEHVYLSSINMKFETKETQAAILILLLNGAIDQIVED
jgi:AcrR family transcriptional regulator